MTKVTVTLMGEAAVVVCPRDPEFERKAKDGLNATFQNGVWVFDRRNLGLVSTLLRLHYGTDGMDASHYEQQD